MSHALRFQTLHIFSTMKYVFCTIIGKFHAENEKDLPNRFWPAHTFLYLSFKLSIIIVIMAAFFWIFSKFEIWVFVAPLLVSFIQKMKKIHLIDSDQHILFCILKICITLKMAKSSIFANFTTFWNVFVLLDIILTLMIQHYNILWMFSYEYRAINTSSKYVSYFIKN